MKYSFSGMTTAEIEAAVKQFEKDISSKLDTITFLKSEIKELRQLRRRAKDLLWQRKNSQYNGEFHILGSFRLKHKKRFKDLTPEERHEYYKSYYYNIQKPKRILKREEAENER